MAVLIHHPSKRVFIFRDIQDTGLDVGIHHSHNTQPAEERSEFPDLVFITTTCVLNNG